MLPLPKWITIITMLVLIVTLIPYSWSRRKTMERPERVVILFCLCTAVLTIIASIYDKVFS